MSLCPIGEPCPRVGNHKTEEKGSEWSGRTHYLKFGAKTAMEVLSPFADVSFQSLMLTSFKDKSSLRQGESQPASDGFSCQLSPSWIWTCTILCGKASLVNIRRASHNLRNLDMCVTHSNLTTDF